MFKTLAALVAFFACTVAFAAVEVNQAGPADLQSVKGIGPALTGKILEARKTGAFKNWNDFVARVGGVGEGNAKRLSEGGLTVAGVSYAQAAPAAKVEAKPGVATKAQPPVKR